MKNSSSPLHGYEDSWRTDLGGSISGERVVVRGRNLFTDIKDYPWFKLLLFMITGREFNDDELQMLDSLWALTISYPDPRVWNNRVSALAGTARTTASLGVGAACAVSEAKIYGGQANLAAIDFILDCKSQVNEGVALEEIIKKELKVNRAIYGFGRPVVKGDERIPPIENLMKQLGFDNGEHVKLAYQVEDILKNGRLRMQMNITGLAAAIGADMGFSPYDYYLVSANGFNAGTTACYLDARSKMAGALFPLKCERVKYEGAVKRTWKEI
ncbi:MAG: citrate/2-methylcitrate synthase [Pseudomonadota bacterium]